MDFSLPAVYACCLIVFALDHVESVRRIQFAERILEILEEAKPGNLADLESAMDGHIASSRRFFDPFAEPPEHRVWLELTPALWLDLGVELEPDSEDIVEVRLLAMSSNEITSANVDDQFAVFGWRVWFIALSITVIPASIWLAFCRGSSITDHLPFLASFVALLPLILALPMALLCYIRISM